MPFLCWLYLFCNQFSSSFLCCFEISIVFLCLFGFGRRFIDSSVVNIINRGGCVIARLVIIIGLHIRNTFRFSLLHSIGFVGSGHFRRLLLWLQLFCLINNCWFLAWFFCFLFLCFLLFCCLLFCFLLFCFLFFFFLFFFFLFFFFLFFLCFQFGYLCFFPFTTLLPLQLFLFGQFFLFRFLIVCVVRGWVVLFVLAWFRVGARYRRRLVIIGVFLNCLFSQSPLLERRRFFGRRRHTSSRYCTKRNVCKTFFRFQFFFFCFLLLMIYFFAKKNFKISKKK